MAGAVGFQIDFRGAEYRLEALQVEVRGRAGRKKTSRRAWSNSLGNIKTEQALPDSAATLLLDLGRCSTRP